MKLREFKKYIPLYLMLLPGLVYLFINNYIPMAGIVVAFKQFNVNDGIFKSPWCGLDNFVYLFTTNDAFVIIRNTLLYNVAFILINNVVGIAIAVMIHDCVSGRLKKLYQSAILLPFLLSIIIISYIVFAFLSHENGIINNSLLKPMGREAILWYTSPGYWPVILVLVNLWKGVGYGCLIYIAALTGIDRSFYEAAELDGASRWQRLKYITLPSLMPTVITLFLLNVGRIFYSDFGLFYQVPQNSGALFDTTNTIDTFVYRALVSAGGIGRSSSAGLLQSLVGFVLVLCSNWIVRRASKENALF